MRFALNKLDIDIFTINYAQWKIFLHGKNIFERPVLIFTCGDQQNCFTPDDRLIVAATFVNIILYKHIIFIEKRLNYKCYKM